MYMEIQIPRIAEIILKKRNKFGPLTLSQNLQKVSIIKHVLFAQEHFNIGAKTIQERNQCF